MDTARNILRKMYPDLEHSKLGIELMRYSSMNRYTYPWDGLKEDLIQNKSNLSLIGYGSLLNTESARLTLDIKIIDNSSPVVAFGVRRIFNYPFRSIPERYGPPLSPRHISALNCIATYNSKDIVNGLLLDIPLYGLDSIISREVDYDLIQVPVLYWRSNKRDFKNAYILSYAGHNSDKEEILPHVKYYEICREGASAVDDEFLKLWLHTTYLNDRLTSVSQWERS